MRITQILPLLCILCITQVLFAQKNKLKRELQYQHNIENNKASVEKKTKIQELYFNVKGQKTKSLSYSSKGELTHSYRYTHKDNEVKTFAMLANQTKRLDAIQELNDQGGAAKIIRYNPQNGQQLDCKIYAYDDQGQMIKEEYFGAENKKVYSIQQRILRNQQYAHELYSDLHSGNEYIAAVELNNQGQPLIYTLYDKASSVFVQKIIFVRNGRGDILEKRTYKSETELAMREIYTYNDKGKLSTYALYIGKENSLKAYTSYAYEYY